MFLAKEAFCKIMAGLTSHGSKEEGDPFGGIMPLVSRWHAHNKIPQSIVVGTV